MTQHTLQILYPSVTCDHKAGYQVIPTWACQGRKVQSKKQLQTKKNNYITRTLKLGTTTLCSPLP